MQETVAGGQMAADGQHNTLLMLINHKPEQTGELRCLL